MTENLDIYEDLDKMFQQEYARLARLMGREALVLHLGSTCPGMSMRSIESLSSRIMNGSFKLSKKMRHTLSELYQVNEYNLELLMLERLYESKKHLIKIAHRG